MNEFHVATDFSPYLGGRYRDDGEFSGEEFRDEHLLVLVENAIQSGRTIKIDFDGVLGMPTSFLEEAFGGMMRARPQWALSEVERAMKIEAPRSPRLKPFIELATQFLKRASKSRG